MAHLIEVAFRGNRKEFFSWDGETPPPLKAAVIVDADRGKISDACIRPVNWPTSAAAAAPWLWHGTAGRRALRLATREDEQIDRELTEQNEQARRAAMERVKANGLVMKLTDAEWQWDRRKLTIYFTAERRVDFRALVRDLAALFKTRIELKQIGVRDEAKRLSGVGRCGREYCSSSWLPDLRPVNLGVAKDQRLSLNPQQISGRLRSSHVLSALRARVLRAQPPQIPKEGKILNTSVVRRGDACDIFHERVTLRTSEGDSRVITLAELRAEVDGYDAATLSTTMEHASPLAGALDEGTVSMLDTQEFETVILTSPDFAEEVAAEHMHRPARLAKTGAVVTASPEMEPEVEPETESGTSEENDAPAAQADASADAPASADDTPADASTDAPLDAPRRKRRRGRRGGRRLRAAEERRRAETGEPADDPEQADEDEDGEAD